MNKLSTNLFSYSLFLMLFCVFSFGVQVRAAQVPLDPEYPEWDEKTSKRLFDIIQDSLYELNKQIGAKQLFFSNRPFVTTESTDLLEEVEKKESKFFTIILTGMRPKSINLNTKFKLCDSPCALATPLLNIFCDYGNFDGIFELLKDARNKGLVVDADGLCSLLLNKFLQLLSLEKKATELEAFSYKKRLNSYIQKGTFDRLIELFGSWLGAHHEILKKAFLLALGHGLDESIYNECKEQLCSLYQKLLPYYAYGDPDYYGSPYYFTIFAEAKESMTPTLLINTKIRAIGRRLAIEDFNSYKKEKLTNVAYMPNPLFLGTLLANGCCEEIDYLMIDQKNYKNLVEAKDINSSLFGAVAKDRRVFEDKLLCAADFIATKKAIVRFFAYALDVKASISFDFLRNLKDQELPLFNDLMIQQFKGLGLMHRAVRAGNFNAVECFLTIDPLFVDQVTTDGLTPICFVAEIQDRATQLNMVRVLANYYKKANKTLTHNEPFYLNSRKCFYLVKAFEKVVDPLFKEKAQQEEIEALRQKAQQKIEQLKQQESTERASGQNRNQEELKSLYVTALQDKENLRRQELESKYHDSLKYLKSLQFFDQHQVARTSILDQEALLIDPLLTAFNVGQASLTQKKSLCLESFLLESPAKTPQSQRPPSFFSSPASSFRSSVLADRALDVELCLTPREQSKVTYQLEGDYWAKAPQQVLLDPFTIATLNQLGEGERTKNPWIDPLLFSNAIPCDQRVEVMRTAKIRLDRGTVEQLTAENYKVFDHAMTTDFIRKVIQCGSVYGQLRKNRNNEWVFNVLLVANIKELNHSEQFEPFAKRVPKKWVSLGFEVSVSGGDSIELGNVFHFCVQETHPWLVKEINEADGPALIKFFLAPLGGVSGLFENKVLRLKCNGGMLRGVKEFLMAMKDAYFQGNQINRYLDQWKAGNYRDQATSSNLSSPAK